MLGISVDSHFCHKAYAATENIPFPLLSDFNKEVAQSYGVLGDSGPWRGVASRAVFIVRRDGTVAYVWHAPPSGGLPDVEQVLEEARKASE